MPKIDPKKKLESFIRVRRVVEMKDLCETTQSSSRMTVFRRLSGIEYLCSYTHAGRYYTLKDIARFDTYGLWFYNNIGFSRNGSLKNTINCFVDDCDAGKFHSELERQLKVRVHNALLGLVKSKQVGRTRFGGKYLYTCIDPTRSKGQIEQRHRLALGGGYGPLSISESMVIEVLVEVIRQSREHPDVEKVTSALNEKGIALATEDVSIICDRYDVEKKIQDSH
jgi:hypothetical protein